MVALDQNVVDVGKVEPVGADAEDFIAAHGEAVHATEDAGPGPIEESIIYYRDVCYFTCAQAEASSMPINGSAPTACKVSLKYRIGDVDVPRTKNNFERSHRVQRHRRLRRSEIQ